MRFLSHLARARLLLYVCGASPSTGWAHTSHTQTQTHSQAKTHASPCANPYGDADGYGNSDSFGTSNCNPFSHCHGYGDSDGFGTSNCNPFRHCHGYGNSDSFGTSNCNPPTATATPTGTPLPGVPTLVQHVASGMDRYPINVLTVDLPNVTGAGNCLVLGVQFKSDGTVSSITDDKGNAWVNGPTVTNASFGRTMSLYYAPNVAAGTKKIEVHFSDGSYPHAVISEFYNVATSNPLDGSAASSTSRTAGTITTTQAGDLIYEWGASLSSTYSEGGAFNGTSIGAGTNFTLLSADLQVGSGDQYFVQPAAGPVTPTFSASGNATWGSLAVALKSAQAGTAPPTGIRIVHLQHTLLQSVRAQNRSEPIVMQFPSNGNLLIGLYNSAGPFATSVTDGLGNTWSAPDSAISGLPTSQIVWAANAQTSPNLSGITVTMSEVGTGDVMFNLYDVVGADASPFDLVTTAAGNQQSFGALTTGTLTPVTSDGLVIHVNSIDFHQLNTMNAPAGGFFDTFTNDLESNDVSTLDMDNGYAHIYNEGLGEIDFTFTACCSTDTGVGGWSGVTAAFKPALHFDQ